LTALFEGLPEDHGFSIHQEEFDKFMRFRDSINKFADSLQSITARLSKNGTSVLAPSGDF
jgi:hypothetical protein